MGAFNNKELMEYLKTFPGDAEVQIIVLDCHEERKYSFPVSRLALITDEDHPVFFLDVNRKNPIDVTREEEDTMKVIRTETVETEWTGIRKGDKFEVGGITFVVLDRPDDAHALIQQFDHLKDHVFNDDGGNKYEGSDVQRYLHTDYRDYLPADFLNAVEGDFFLLSEDEVLKYCPDELSRIRLDEEGCTTWWWTSTPYVGYGYGVRSVIPSGRVGNYYAIGSSGVAPACTINLASLESAPTGA